MIYELWHSSEENSYTFIPRNDDYDRAIKQYKKLNPGLKQIWSYDAKTYFEAMQAYYDYMGYGEYKPEPEWEDIVHE